jgi:hypothetical protein
MSNRRATGSSAGLQRHFATHQPAFAKPDFEQRCTADLVNAEFRDRVYSGSLLSLNALLGLICLPVAGAQVRIGSWLRLVRSAFRHRARHGEICKPLALHRYAKNVCDSGGQTSSESSSKILVSQYKSKPVDMADSGTYPKPAKKKFQIIIPYCASLTDASRWNRSMLAFPNPLKLQPFNERISRWSGKQQRGQNPAQLTAQSGTEEATGARTPKRVGGGGERAEGGRTLRRVARAYYLRGAHLFAQILHRRCPDLSFAQSLHNGVFAHFLHGFSYPRLPTNAAIVLNLRHVWRIPVSAPV